MTSCMHFLWDTVFSSKICEISFYSRVSGCNNYHCWIQLGLEDPLPSWLGTAGFLPLARMLPSLPAAHNKGMLLKQFKNAFYCCVTCSSGTQSILANVASFTKCTVLIPSAEVAAVCWKLFLESTEGAAFVSVKLT